MRREAQAKTESLESFLSGLNLVMTPHPIGPENIERVVQLINKTNQFNLTNRRHSRNDVQKLVMNPDTYSFCFHLSDRFGDTGIIGVLIAVPEIYNKYGIGYKVDTFLLSCRVMGRTVEYAIFSHLHSWLMQRKINNLYGEFIPTKKNAPVRDLYQSLGFKLILDGSDMKLFQKKVIPEFETEHFVHISELS